MSTPTVDRIENDRTPMGICSSCKSPVDVQGRATSAAYIRMVEAEREAAISDLGDTLLALEPFAKMATRYKAEHPDTTVVLTCQNEPVVTLGDLRRAKHLIDQH